MATAAKRKSKAMMRAEIVNWLGMGAAANPRFKTGRAICDELVAEGLAYKEDDGYWATADLRRAKRQATVKDMGKKRATGKKIPKTPRQQFAARLKELAGDRPASYYAPLWGCKPDAALKYMRGDRTPKLDLWPRIAASFGLQNWQDLLPPVE